MGLTDQLKSLSHHAYALIGGDLIRDELISILTGQHSIQIHGNQDYSYAKYLNFTIDDARKLKEAHSMRPVVEGGRKIFIIHADNISAEAQNALLKLLEEPAEYAHFFIIIPSSHLLIPTVKSRLLIIESRHDDGSSSGSAIKSGIDEATYEQALKFVKATPAKRLEMVKVLMDAITKENVSKQDAIDLLNAIQAVVYREKGAKIGKAALESIETARKYMNDRSPSLKMLMEYVALNI